MEFVRRLGGFLMPGGRMGAVGARQQAAPVFDPFSLGWEAAHWASDPGWTPPAADGAVDSWRDGAGNGHTVTQATSGKQPLYRTSVAKLNGKPGIDFDGVDDYLQTASFAMAQPISAVIVASDYLVSGSYRYLWGSGQPPGLWFRSDVTTGILQVFAGSIIGSPLVFDSDAHLWRGYYNGNSGAAAKDGTSVTGDTYTYGIGGGYAIGAIGPGADRGWADVNVAFVGVYAGDVTANPNWAAFKTWVTSFYGITV